MPVNRVQFAQLVILMLAIPAQYLLTERWGSKSELIRTKSVQQLLTSFADLSTKFKYWVKVAYLSLKKLSVIKFDLKSQKDLEKNKQGDLKDSSTGECIAKEVFQYRDPTGHGYFSQSTASRSPRPDGLKFRVGQVIKHKKYGYRGVIIGWDETCKAPKNWIAAMHGRDLPIEKTPHYSVLVDKRDRRDIQTTYVAQENIIIVSNVEVLHPSLWNYFNLYDGAQYHMRPAMQELYLDD